MRYFSESSHKTAGSANRIAAAVMVAAKGIGSLIGQFYFRGMLGADEGERLLGLLRLNLIGSWRNFLNSTGLGGQRSYYCNCRHREPISR